MGTRVVRKSTLLYGICQDLIRAGVSMEQIIFVYFEDERLAEFQAKDFNDLVEIHHSWTDKRGFYFLSNCQQSCQ